MINIVLYGILGFCAFKALQKPSSTGTSSARSRAPIGGFSGGISVPKATPRTQGPSSGAGLPAGNANQPWYSGAVVAGAGVAAAQLAKGLTGLFSSSPEQTEVVDETAETVDESDLAASQDEMATDSESASYDDEGDFDYSDESGLE